MEYTLLDGSGSRQGSGTLGVEVEGDATTLTAHFESAPNSDTSTIIVDSETLKPVSSSREIDNQNPDDEELLEAEYTEDGVLIRAGDRQSGISVEEHSYDNDTSLFLWRTIDFAENYEASYNTVITNQRSKQKVILQVTGKETITVPAGEFQTWRLEIITSNARQIAWYADTEQRPLIRYDNDRGTVFELAEAP